MEWNTIEIGSYFLRETAFVSDEAIERHKWGNISQRTSLTKWKKAFHHWMEIENCSFIFITDYEKCQWHSRKVNRTECELFPIHRIIIMWMQSQWSLCKRPIQFIYRSNVSARGSFYLIYIYISSLGESWMTQIRVVYLRVQTPPKRKSPPGCGWPLHAISMNIFSESGHFA